ncbi:phosphoenolpyruvate--protein phosphotransferase [Feifania hominis]|uniref:Phosphoenolpyruvate-protein phosphotransferase n=1 Tax=Feifania hominis TaxID=2763660 RepID=A0A926HU02_9FIRM|nr:phosphoenolpyruvate--protein phosphotransferase [Feifania hominis]MBC8535430.1 phosphoenolpyruvate--protein phosphotransferase [Feifania hominis]
MEKVVKGLGVVKGIAVGKLKIIKTDFEEAKRAYVRGTPQVERQRYEAACEHVLSDLSSLLERFQNEGRDTQVEIINAHDSIVKDEFMRDKIIQNIEAENSAVDAIRLAAVEVSAMFEGIDDPYLKERATDIGYVGNMLTKAVLGIGDPKFDEDNLIVYSEEVEPSLIASFPSDKVKGIVMGNASLTSHAVIIAKARDFLTVVGVGDCCDGMRDGDECILDSYEGVLIVRPNEKTRAIYEEKLREERERQQLFETLIDLPAETLDHREVTIAANVGSVADMDNALAKGCKGVGLFRTEFVFMEAKSFPGEEEQFSIYKKVIEKCGGELCVIRTIDIGGDKPLSYFDFGKEDNPFLGWRAIRMCLANPDVFIIQLKAILRAAKFGRAGVMLPMVTSVSEVKTAKQYVETARRQLEEAGMEYGDIQIGIMVETPAAVLMAPALARECDFFSIGTNDLVQYIMAADRGNAKISYLYDYFNPAVLRAIKMVADAAHDAGIWVGMCGEMAGDIDATELLVAIGIDELSMNASSILEIKNKVRHIKVNGDLLSAALKMTDPTEVREYLSNKW